MIRVLHITSELDGGGIERLLYNYYNNINHLVRFDFAINSERIGILEEAFRDLGCNIYRIPKYRDGINEFQNRLKEILSNNHYDIIHVHSAYKACIALQVAKKSGINVRIAHSHIANAPEDFKSRIVRLFLTPLTKRYATHLFSCGVKAGEWAWGRKCFSFGNVYIMPNSICVENFKFSKEKRKQIRKELRCEDKYVIGNVARFSYQKNHEFLLNVFKEIQTINPNCVLWLIGNGELESEIRKQISDLQIGASVFMLGTRNDVPDLLNGIDMFMLPSRFEGLPVTLIETQTNGVKTMASDSITQEMKITDCLQFLPLKKELWVRNYYLENNDLARSRCYETLERSEYNIKRSAINLVKKYEELLDIVNTPH